jgi:capsular polysaccharide transport system ATP-binding protein
MIELRHVTKSYPTLHGRRYVFRDLNFRFPDDASIGLIGPNGAGKSTLMRLLGGIDAPDSGRVITDANISWPVGLSGGMQTTLTGRDNVRFVCRVYGATGQTMRRKMAAVEAFAEIGEYFDLPVRSYSSGMRSRLAFGLSMAFDFDYYLIDEVMAVGDALFRSKCQEAFRARLSNANLILVSHNMGDIREWCDVVVLVRDGTATLYEDVEAGIAAYQGPINVERRRTRRRIAQRYGAAATERPVVATVAETT